MYKDTITLFNRYMQAAGDIWYPNILTGVNVVMDKGEIVKVYGESSSDNIIVNIRHTDGLIETDGGYKQWYPPKEWQRLSDHNQGVTFTGGSAFDFLWVGEWAGGSPVYDDMYGDLSFYDYMLQNFDYVFAVTSVSLLSVIPHFEVTGK